MRRLMLVFQLFEEFDQLIQLNIDQPLSLSLWVSLLQQFLHTLSIELQASLNTLYVSL